MVGARTLDEWAQRRSIIHARDARVKLAALALLLICISTTPGGRWWSFAAYCALLIVVAVMARVPVLGVLARASVIVPFAGAAAAVAALTQGLHFAATVLVRSYLSALAVVLVAATTPAPALFRGLRSLGCPRSLGLVLQFLYRFLSLTGEQAARLRIAARSRQGLRKHRRNLITAAAGSIAVLFASAYARAARVHSAMLARGFDGEIRLASARAATAADWMFLLAAAGLVLGIRSR